MATFEAIIRSYRADAERRDAEHKWWADPAQTLREAVRRSALSEVPGRRRLVRHGHQCRIPGSVLAEAASVLTDFEAQIAACTTFDELHDLVTVACRGVPGTGELFKYDAAHRIGLYRGIHPTKIYLHQGTRDGARALGIKVAGRKYIDVAQLPAPLRVLSAAEAEDVLCIYKSSFGTASNSGKRTFRLGCAPSPPPAGRC